MEWFVTGLALLLPWIAATLWLSLLWPQPSPGRWPMVVGYGFVLGMLLASLLLYLLGVLGFGLQVLLPLGIIALLAIGAGLLLRRQSGVAAAAAASATPDTVPLWQWLLFALVLLWIVVRLAGLALEVWWQPLFPWDAWTTWAVRSRVWTEEQALLPFIPPRAWLADPVAEAYTIDAWDYPSTVSLISAWPSLAYGEWRETAANLPWLGCAIALLLGLYGQSRNWGASPLVAVVFIWILISLPLLDTHIALAGYADLWMAALLGFAFMAFMHWARYRDWRQGLLTVVLVLCLLLIKREGLIWVGVFVPALLAVWVRWSIWLLLGVAAIALGFAVWVTGGLTLSLPMLGELTISAMEMSLPYFGRFEIGHQGDYDMLGRHLLLRSNWHLLIYLLVVALVLAIWHGLTQPAPPWYRAGLVWVLAALSAVYLLFFWTGASAWVTAGTSINRILLQFAPAFVFWLMTVSLTLASRRRDC
jgi:hypothetical protein